MHANIKWLGSCLKVNDTDAYVFLTSSERPCFFKDCVQGGHRSSRDTYSGCPSDPWPQASDAAYGGLCLHSSDMSENVKPGYISSFQNGTG